MRRVFWIAILLCMVAFVASTPVLAQTGFAEGGDDKSDDPPPPDCEDSSDPDCDDSCLDVPVDGGGPVAFCQLVGASGGAAIQENFDCHAQGVTQNTDFIGRRDLSQALVDSGDARVNLFIPPGSQLDPLDEICFAEEHEHMIYTCVGLLDESGHGKFGKLMSDPTGVDAGQNPSRVKVWVNDEDPVEISLAGLTVATANAQIVSELNAELDEAYTAWEGATYIHVGEGPGSLGIDKLCLSIDDTSHTMNVVTIDQSLFDATNCTKTPQF